MTTKKFLLEVDYDKWQRYKSLIDREISINTHLNILIDEHIERG